MEMSLPEEMEVLKFVFNYNFILGLSAKQVCNSTSPFAMSACTTATLKRADCREICYLKILLNSVPTLSFSLKPDKRAAYAYDLSASSGTVIDTGCILFEVSIDAKETVSRRSSRRKNEGKSKVQLRTGREGSQGE